MTAATRLIAGIRWNTVPQPGQTYLWSIPHIFRFLSMMHQSDTMKAHNVPERLCIHCRRKITRANSSRDHVPSKCLLRAPFPDNMTTIRICADCNWSFSPNEEYMAAFLGTLLWEGEDRLSRLERILYSNWRLQDDLDNGLRVEIDEAGARVALEPDGNRLRCVVSKNAVGHLHLAQNCHVAGPPSMVSICALENLPTDMRKVLFGMSSLWITVQEGVYRFCILDDGRIFVRSVIHERVATEAVWEAPK